MAIFVDGFDHWTSFVQGGRKWDVCQTNTTPTGGRNNSGYIGMGSVAVEKNFAAAAFTDTVMQLPANAVVFGVSVRVTTAIPTATTFTVGVSVAAARFSTVAVSTVAATTDSGTKAGAYYNNAAAVAIRITPNLTPATATGVVRVTAHFYTITPPTS